MDIQMVGVLWLIGAFSLGLLNCFFGYRLFIVTVAIVGFLLGASLGYALGAFVGSSIAGLIAAAVLGLIGAWASVSAYYAFIFVAGAFGFALFAAFVAGLFGSDVHVAVPIVAGLIGGFLALWLQRVVIILATAAQGALASVLAAASLVSGGGVQAYRALFYRLLDGDISRLGSFWLYLGLFSWLVLFAAGLAAQFTRGKEMYRRQGRKAIAP